MVGEEEEGRLRGGDEKCQKVTGKGKEAADSVKGSSVKEMTRIWEWSCAQRLGDTEGPVAGAPKNLGRQQSQSEKDLSDAVGGERHGVGA